MFEEIQHYLETFGKTICNMVPFGSNIKCDKILHDIFNGRIRKSVDGEKKQINNPDFVLN